MSDLYMTVEYFPEKGLKVIGNDYPRSLKDCAAAVERLRRAHRGSRARFGIVQLVEMRAIERPAIVVDWLRADETPTDGGREIEARADNLP